MAIPGDFRKEFTGWRQAPFHPLGLNPDQFGLHWIYDKLSPTYFQ